MRMLRIVVGGVILVGLAAIVRQSLPDLRRYLRIRRM
jgi:hypothetical protein